MIVLIFSPWPEDAATHGSGRGYRVPRQLDPAGLSREAISMLERMENDLSGLLEDDDLIPRLRVHETIPTIEEAADGLGFDSRAAKAWTDMYGPLGGRETSRAHRAQGLAHAAKGNALASAINALAATPGLRVHACRADKTGWPVNATELDTDAPARSRVWKRMLTSAAK